MPKKTNLITVPIQNEHYKGTDFKRWGSFVANFIKDHRDRKVKPPANSKNKGKRNNDR